MQEPCAGNREGVSRVGPARPLRANAAVAAAAALTCRFLTVCDYCQGQIDLKVRGMCGHAVWGVPGGCHPGHPKAKGFSCRGGLGGMSGTNIR